MACLSSIKLLHFLEHASDTPLTKNAHVIHTYPLEDWGFSFRIAPEQEFFPISLLGTMARPVNEEMQLLV